MSRTVRSLTAGTIPSSTAWRARSLLVQWEMCKPLAIGSRQANRTSRARCRGGNPGWSPGPLGWCQKIGQARILVATADPPDGRRIALGPDGQLLDRLARGNREENLSPLDLVPGQGAASRDLLEEREIVGNDLQGTRSSTTHGATPIADLANKGQLTSRPNFLHYFVPEPLASRTVLKAEQVRGLAVITSAAVRGGRVGSAIGEGSRKNVRDLILWRIVTQFSDRNRLSGICFAPELSSSSRA
jgi:hypothetical protein